MKTNSDIRETALLANVKQWEIADALGISESTLSKKLRKELDEETKMKIFVAIAKISEGRPE